MTEETVQIGKNAQTTWKTAPTWIFVEIMLAIFIVESLDMVLLHYAFPSLSIFAKVVLDGLILLVFLSPALYLLILKPFLRQNEERKRYEADLADAFAELHDRNRFIESILTHIQSGIIVTDPDMRINLANDYVSHFFGRNSAELIGAELAEVCPGIFASICAGIDAAEVAVNSSSNYLIVGFKRVDLKRVDGTLAGHIITFVDISEIIKFRNEMRKKERLATMGEVVARVAHEMRNPLFGITAAAQILAMELKLTAPQKELMNSLFTEARRMNHLVEELLDCSKEMILKKTPFDLVKALNESLSFNEVFIIEKKLNLQKRLPDGELTVVADPERVRQVMVNILKNAVDATATGGTIAVGLVKTGGDVSIHVTDSGPGIADDAIEKIFDVFYTTKKHGTGLGLSISRKIADAHDGALTASNNAGGGATFTFTLPVGAAA
ncbi:sensor histidine kinase [Geotalea uraniireducens]|uniref:histidine kinase n=1 Tax=Geotalea uraniireducens (strain Rf4) TaxID=351605 RepID=A5G504_GEOUR|nr:ATP-binding protein [Geotalea uraniireducens]ABQ26872.1 multi-sensor signal transduction histidine kinase [Geotalea uraniireducens Rf4]